MGSVMSDKYDVVICGGGPVGLVIGYALQRMNISTVIVEKIDKDDPDLPMYGRAATLWSRTLEMLDQLELLDDFNQQAFIASNMISYDGDGKRIVKKGAQRTFEHMEPTYLKYFLNLRLKYSEDITRAAYRKAGGTVLAGWQVLNLTTAPKGEDAYRVTTTINSDSNYKTLLSKYLIGADGAGSDVRTLCGITTTKSLTDELWVRVDGIIETDIPDLKLGTGTLLSKTHGNALWLNLDRDRVRIGFPMNPAMKEKYGDKISKEDAVREASMSFAPFKIEFKTVDWHTSYRVRQGVADTYLADDCIFLAGDAAHSHTSAAGQGMNTGIHDAVNLSWKLGGFLKGWYREDILYTYEDERRPIAQNVIRLDRIYSKLISGEVPEEYKGTKLSFNDLLGLAFEESSEFNLGLTIGYENSLINHKVTSGMVVEGARAPDALVFAPGRQIPVRLQLLARNTGIFTVVVFAGEPLLTKDKISSFRAHIEQADAFTKVIDPEAYRFITVIAGHHNDGGVAIGGRPFGNQYFDYDHLAHHRFGFSTGRGGIAVIRPDGHLAFAAGLDGGEEISDYFRAIFV